MHVNLLCLGAVGLGAVVLTVAHRHGLIRKHGVDLQLVPVPGTQIPELSSDHPFGHIGAPAAVMRAADGTDLRILASFDTARLSSCLVARPGIDRPELLRGRRLGARVTGAAMWIHTVLALEAVGLDPKRDRIQIDEIGDPSEVARALQAGEIDAAVLARAQCEQLALKGYSIVLDLFPLNVLGAPDALVCMADFLRRHPDAAEAIVAGLIEGAAFTLSPRHRTSVLETIKTELKIADTAAAESGLSELSKVVARKPYPSITRLREMQRIMTLSRPTVANVVIDDLIDDRIVRKMDDTSVIDGVYASYGVV
jgi:ABC-type nitrate/sulfonate/bicarbonate transport system substrate-binding protein